MTHQAEGRSARRASVFHRQRGIAGACTTACSSGTSQFGERVDSECSRHEARLPQTGSACRIALLVQAGEGPPRSLRERCATTTATGCRAAGFAPERALAAPKWLELRQCPADSKGPDCACPRVAHGKPRAAGSAYRWHRQHRSRREADGYRERSPRGKRAARSRQIASSSR
jgi:hypothetical protein